MIQPGCEVLVVCTGGVVVVDVFIFLFLHVCRKGKRRLDLVPLYEAWSLKVTL
jgi:hypothetical protein